MGFLLGRWNPPSPGHPGNIKAVSDRDKHLTSHGRTHFELTFLNFGLQFESQFLFDLTSVLFDMNPLLIWLKFKQAFKVHEKQGQCQNVRIYKREKLTKQK